MYNWKPIAPELCHGIITSYNLTLRDVNGSLVRSFELNGTSLSHIVTGLETGTNYSAVIRGSSNKGDGPWTSEILVSTLKIGKTMLQAK